jgi:hypothetical protein
MCERCAPTRLLLEREIGNLRRQLAHVNRLVRHVVEQWEADTAAGMAMDVSILLHTHVAALRAWVEEGSR